MRQAVFERLRDPNDYVCGSAVIALSGVVETDQEARRAVFERIRDPSSFIRVSALSVLSGIVKTDQAARHEVLDCLGCADGYIRSAALSALSGVLDTEEEARRVALELLEDPDDYVRGSALSALSGTIEMDGEVRRAVLGRLEDPDEYVRGAALSALRRFVGTDEELRRTVVGRLVDSMDYVRSSALYALSGLVRTNEEVRNAMLNGLDDRSELVRQQAVQALSDLMGDFEVRQLILQRLSDQDFLVRLGVVKAIAEYQDDTLLVTMRSELLSWLNVDGGFYSEEVRSVQGRLAKWFGSQLTNGSSLHHDLLRRLHEPRWSERLGAALALLAWPGGPPEEVMTQVLAALEDRRGLEAYSARVTAASYLINRNDMAAEAIDLCLEALDYGTQPWEGVYGSRYVRQQAASVLGKLEPISYDARIYDKLLHVLRNDEDAGVCDAAYGTLVRLARMRDQQAVA